ncbi:MAG: 4-(cytidine 5'-diphospho)-2-C-methyl-D-erythritol kinase [Chloroflexi bacterium]|nr:4-(cytidine 5'-diphospho)-2-C-methyl-D-erythritol kinase [Chloroflexota bacterium]
MSVLTTACPAKINVGLEIVGRRPDGYHELVTIFQAIALADTLTVAPAGDLSLVCSEPALATDDNLVLRAARLLQAATGVRQGAGLTLTKRIPAAAGLGGGSSDAAGALRLLNELWATRLTTDDLVPLATRLGADVPFFLRGGTALATGIGDRLTALPDGLPLWLVLLMPPVAIEGKTARLYRSLTPADWSDGARTRMQADRLRTGQALDPALIANAFARPLRELFPPLAAAETMLRQVGATTVFPAGSGPTLVALVAGRAVGDAVVECLKQRGHPAQVVATSPAEARAP